MYWASGGTELVGLVDVGGCVEAGWCVWEAVSVLWEVFGDCLVDCVGCAVDYEASWWYVDVSYARDCSCDGCDMSETG